MYMHACIYVRMYVCMHVCTHACMYEEASISEEEGEAERQGVGG